MVLFERIKRFIRRIFIDYGKINNLIEEHSRITTENYLKETQKFNEKLSIVEEKLNSICNNNEKNVVQIKNDIKSLAEKIEEFKYSNSEIQSIRNDKSVKNILIVGFYGAPNLGDELMLETLLDYLDDIPNKQITILLADNIQYSIDKYKDVKFLHYPKNLNDFNILADQFDYIIFGGGAIIDDKQYDVPNAYQYDLGTILIKLAIRGIAFKKKVICLALSASHSLKNQEYLEKLQYIIENATYFSVRDIFTKELIENKIETPNSNKVQLINDIVFSNEKILPNIRKKKSDKIKNIGIVAISNNDLKQINEIIRGIDKFDKGVNINLIPFYDYNHIDTNFYNRVKDNNDFKTNINIEKFSNNMSKIIEIFEKNDIIIGARYHSILLAYILNIPCISICYDIHEHYLYKINYLNKMFQGECINYSTLKQQEILLKLHEIAKQVEENKDIYNNCIKINKNSSNQMQKIIKDIFID